MALEDDDLDAIRKVVRDEASKFGKGKKSARILWKRRGIIAAILVVLALFAAPGFFQDVAIFHSSPDGSGTPIDQVGAVVMIGLFIWFFLLRPMMKGKSGGDSKPAAKASSGH